MNITQLIKMSLAVLLPLSAIDANASLKSMSVGPIAAAEPQKTSSKTEPSVPYSQLDGYGGDYTDVFAVPLDMDEADEDLEIEQLERMGSESKK